MNPFRFATFQRARLGPSAGGRPAGIFITHVLNDRIQAHFDRLRSETREIIDWQFAYNPWTLGDLVAGRGEFEIDRTSVRVRQAVNNGSLSSGYMDIVLFSLVKSANREFVWVLEYDVDFAGRWLDFFQQFSNNSADLLTTTLNTRRRDPRWAFWNSANGPCPKSRFTRAFMPIMRVSRRFIGTYEEALSTGKWSGHYEFLVPTIARVHGLRIEDIGGTGPFVPWRRRRRNYLNVAKDALLSPGTFVWRPSMTAYFHEDDTAFKRRAMLYHPIKADVVEWETEAPVALSEAI
ncbi:hypothetical protein RFM41_22165 [Mesorhizobium sp. VK25A]|uniref:DUF707 domain-containing protein n=1 Tax=Mesorhizobium vachelliae TaxID=3072309 RepID=A0ABU5A8M4_9HYPH|nr:MULTISPECIES: hypothetical protein [unclassified Mesorhizobium]MDX8534059.1 hypothetical protein [Mesorhizobium sp. VK25D]MDX8546470.1 hypothetical protein [Mesorhizobium sp. VK25A]